MTVSTELNKVTYQGNGTTVQWSFSFATPAATDITVIVTDSSGNVNIIPTTQYIITVNPAIQPNPTPIGGIVTYPLIGPPLAAGNSITIVRDLDAVQPVSLNPQSVIYPPVIEEELDYLTMLDQQSNELLSRAFVVPPSDPPPAFVPTVSLRKNQQAFFDAMGNLVAGAFSAPTPIISAAMQPVVAAATIALAQQLLGTQAMINASILTIYSTGDLKPTHKTVADPGWILWIDGTIGDVNSGASVRNNGDTQALFTLYYNSYNDATCPLFTQGGVATTRAAQGTAAAAFGAECKITLPIGSGRAVCLAGNGAGLIARPAGSVGGVESVTPSTLTLAPHQHAWGQFGAPITQYPDAYGYNNETFSGTHSISYTDMLSAGSGQPFFVVQPSTFINFMVKL